MGLISTILFLSAAKSSYELVSNRKAIIRNTQETVSESKRFNHLQAQLKDQLQTLQTEAQKISPLAQDLSYKAQAFEKEAQARAGQIQAQMEQAQAHVEELQAKIKASNKP